MPAHSPYKITKMTLEDPELAKRFNNVLASTVQALEGTGIRYAFIGGIASGGLGRPRSTHDIDLFVMPDDAENVLVALAKAGFRTERTDPSWLYKGFKDDILVDVIFKSKGEIYLDTEMYRRLIEAEYHGTKLRFVCAEDLLIIKAAAHSELTPGHWHDAIGLLSHAGDWDWAYLLRRARRAPRRVLSVLLYAQASDVWVPNHVIHELYKGIFGDAPAAEARAEPRSGTKTPASVRAAPLEPLPQFPSQAPAGTGFADPKVANAYVVPHLRECLAADERTHELDIVIEQQDDQILLRGEVTCPARRETVATIARECYPGLRVENQIRIITVDEPTETEVIK